MQTSEITEKKLIAERLEALGRVSEVIAGSLSLDEQLQTILEEAILHSSAAGGTISLYRETTGAFEEYIHQGSNVDGHLSSDLEQIARDKMSAITYTEFPAEEEIKSALLVPVLYENIPVGLVIINSFEPYHFDDATKEFISTLAKMATVAIVNARIYQDTLQRERFYAALGRVTLAINSTINLPTLLTLVCKESLGLFSVDGAHIWLRGDGKLLGQAAEGAAQAGLVGSKVDISDSFQFAATIAANGSGSYCNNFQTSQDYQHQYAWQDSVKSILGVPLTQDEEVIGVLELVDIHRNERFRLQDVEQITFFGAQAAIAIQNAKLVGEMRRLNEELDQRVAERTRALGEERDRVQYLLRVTTELASSLDQDRVLIRALELVNEVVQATHGNIHLIDMATGEFLYPAAFETHKLPPLPKVELGLNPEEGLAGWIIKNRTAMIINDTRVDDRWTATQNQELRSVMAVPLIASDEVIGLLTLFHHEPNAFTNEQLELVAAAAMQVASAISNAQLYLLIRDQAERLGNMLRVEHIEAAKNQAILESIADGVLVANDKGRVLLANNAASEILDIPRDQLNGKSLHELLGLYANISENWNQTFELWSRSTKEDAGIGFLSERLSLEDKFVSVRISPVYARGQFFGTVSIFRDVTHAVEIDRMKSEFVSTVSHELRTPMTSIKGYAELLLLGAIGQLTSEQQRYLEIINNNADRMSDLVNDLLDISRIESGRASLDLQEVNLAETVRELANGHAKNLIEKQGKQIAISVDLPDDLPLIIADQDRVVQILTNLIDNAINYTRESGTITISAWESWPFISVSVRDTGSGISPENQHKIFERFYRVENTDFHQVRGTGLGLAIVRSLVEMHGGTIDVASEEGQGSEFTFALPINQKTNDQSETIS